MPGEPAMKTSENLHFKKKKECFIWNAHSEKCIEIRWLFVIQIKVSKKKTKRYINNFMRVSNGQ